MSRMATLSRREMAEIQGLLTTEVHTSSQLKDRRLKELSEARVAKWPNTLAALRSRKEEAKSVEYSDTLGLFFSNMLNTIIPSEVIIDKDTKECGNCRELNIYPTETDTVYVRIKILRKRAAEHNKFRFSNVLKV